MPETNTAVSTLTYASLGDAGFLKCLDGQEYTIEDRLHLGGLIKRYFVPYKSRYQQMFRCMWKERTSPSTDINQKEYVKGFMAKHGVLKRTANSLWYEVSGRMESYMELKKTEADDLQTKLDALDKQIETLDKERKELKERVRTWTATESQKKRYRKVKDQLYWKRNKRNRLSQDLAELKRQIAAGEYHICFGTGKLFGNQFRLKENGFSSHEEWLKAFREKRDANIYYLGSYDETQGNQMFQLTPEKDDSFTAKIRMEDCCSWPDPDPKKKGKNTAYLIIPGIRFRHMGNELHAILARQAACKTSDKKQQKGRLQPVSYRIHFEDGGRKCYLQAMFSLTRDISDFLTDPAAGRIGLDFNDGFIEAAVVDKTGNLIDLKHFDLKYHGQGAKSEAEAEEVVAQISKLALDYRFPTAHEDLDFRKKKAKQLPAKGKHGKAYNQMLHTLDYGRYQKALESCMTRTGVLRQSVNAAYTSKIGKQKYAGPMKLSVHQAAAYVIARRSMGFKDTYFNQKQLKAAKAHKKEKATAAKKKGKQPEAPSSVSIDKTIKTKRTRKTDAKHSK